MRSVSRRRFLALPIASLPLLALRPARARADAPQIFSVAAAVSPTNALIVDMTVTTDAPTDLAIEYGNDSAGTFLLIVPAGATAVQQFSLMRLRADSDYDYRVVASNSDGERSEIASGTFHTGTLPDVFQRWQWEVTGQPTFQMAFSGFNAGGHTGLVALDAAGEVVWYWHLPGGNQIVGVNRLPNGDFVAIITGIGIIEISPDAHIVRLIEDRKGETFTHHDLQVLPNGHVLTLSDVPMHADLSTLGKGTSELIGVPVLREIQMETGESTIRWNALSMIDPASEADIPLLRPLQGTQIDPALDWLHFNSLSVGSHGKYIVSSPFVNTVYSISPDFERIEWRFGGTRSDFRFEDSTDRFYFEHSARELDNGHVLLFDNGGAAWTINQRPREQGVFSRALEFALDRDTMTAHKVWEYRHHPDLDAPIISNVERLANGNTLVNFGVAPLDLLEVDPQGQPLWELRYTALAEFSPPVDLGAFTLRFQVHPLDNLNGEMRLL